MENTPVIQFQRLRQAADEAVPLPRYMTEGSAGMDIACDIPAPITLGPGAIELIPTGFAMAIPAGFEAQIRPRSGLAARHGIGLVNSPGTIDSDYRGEVMIPLINFGKAPFTVNRGDRIAQMVIQQVFQAKVSVVEKLDETPRSSGGFGHTGV